MPPSGRPELTRQLSGAEFLRWYWLKDEVVGFARDLGLRASGPKDLVVRRVAAALDGVAYVEPAPARSPGGAQLAGDLSRDTVIPAGQRCSQAVRAWFVTQVGGGFAFDSPMRAFFAAADGTTTLGDALSHYRATRGSGPDDIDAQFEFNRFTRTWHDRHPGGDRAALLAAWRDYRARPVDERGRA